MSKKSILKRAEQPAAQVKQPVTKVEARQDRARQTESAPGAAAALDADELAAKIADALYAKFAPLLPILARLAAADTVHTAERPETVLRHAVVKEAPIAAALIEEVTHG